MTTPYKVALLATVAVFAFVIFYYATQEPHVIEQGAGDDPAVATMPTTSPGATPQASPGATTPSPRSGTSAQVPATQEAPRREGSELMASIRANMAAAEAQAPRDDPPPLPTRTRQPEPAPDTTAAPLREATQAQTITFDRSAPAQPPVATVEPTTTSRAPDSDTTSAATSLRREATASASGAGDPAPRDPAGTTASPRATASVPVTSPPAPAPRPATATREHTIATGETFSSIAKDVYGHERQWVLIAQANPTVDPTRLQVGQVIRLPAAPAQQSSAATPAVATSPAMPLPQGTRRYVVQAGDTLASIAHHYYGAGRHWRAIYDANRQSIGDNPNRIRAGMELRIPPDVVISR